jgi:CheY-like chemotaxis protein
VRPLALAHETSLFFVHIVSRSIFYLREVATESRPVGVAPPKELGIVDGYRAGVPVSYVLMTANSAEKAFDILANTVVDIVVSDEQMPSMLGSKFLGRVRDAYPNIVRIMLTGEAGLPAALRAINEGPLYRFLNKPLSPDEVDPTLRTRRASC